MKSIIICCISILCFFSVPVLGQNEDVSGGSVFEGEPYLAIDPSNSQHLVLAWMGYVPGYYTTIKTKVSFDGGHNWSAAVPLPHHSPTFKSADVSIVFGHTGTVFACYIDYRQSPDSGGVYVVQSADGGLTWGAPSLVISGYADGSKEPLDRPWLSIARYSGTVPDSLFVTTKPAPWISPPNRPYFTKSGDNGATWSAWRYIDSTGYLVGNIIQAPMAAPAVDSSGKFHCVYPCYLASESIYPRYIMATNGPANSFGYYVAVTVTGGGTIDTLAKAGGHLICDPTNNQHFAFFLLENLLGDLDIYCTETFNGGTTWTTPARVNDDAAGNGKMQDLVWSNFDEHGNMVAAWRDRRNAPGTGYQQPSEIWGTVKWKDSTTFSANFRISDTIVTYDSLYLSGSGNDFMNIALASDTMSAVWGDVRTGVLNIWFSRNVLVTHSAVGIQNIVSEPVPEVNIYPNPAGSFLYIEGENITSYSIKDLGGREILDQKVNQQKNRIDLHTVPAGVYLVEVNTTAGIVARKITVYH